MTIQQQTKTITFLILISLFVPAAVGASNEAISQSSIQGLLVPESRIIGWDAGVRGGIPNVPNRINILDFGAKGDGQTDDTAALMAAIEACPVPGAIYFPKGSYVINGRIEIPTGLVLRGDGPDLTHILATPGEGGLHTFVVNGSAGDPIPLIETAFSGTNQITVADASSFEVGQSAEIVMDNETFMGDVRFDAARGQIVKITAISGNTLFLDVPLKLHYSIEANARIYPKTPKENVGFEDFHIKHVNSDNNQSNIFQFWHAENSWIKNVESEFSARYHISINHSRHITVQDSVIHHSYDYGGGGHGYGVLLFNHTSDSLITNNTLYMLRHALLPAGGSGNVISYNFSADDNSQEDQIGLADLNFHASFSNMDLIEGNVTQWIKVGGSGTTGPYNSIFRNRTMKAPYTKPPQIYRAGLIIDNPSHSQNIIGNTLAGKIESTGLFDGNYAEDLWIEKNLICQDGITGGNLDQDTIVDNILNCNQSALWELPPSLYLSEKPDFWPDGLPWPAIGADIDAQRMSAGLPLLKIPAQIRYEQIMGLPPTSTPTPEPTTPLPPSSTPTPEPTTTPIPPTTTPMPTDEPPTPLPTIQPDTISLALDGPTTVAPNETFNMDVVARNIPDPGLYGVQFEINYDPNMVSVSNVQVNPSLTFVVENNVDNAIGKIKFAASQQGKIPGLMGDANLLRFNATAVNSPGQINFSFQDEKISDDQAQSLMVISHQYSISIENNGATPPESTVQPTIEPPPTNTVVPPTPESTVYPTPQPTEEPVSMIISGRVILTGRNNDNWSDAIVSIESSGITSSTDVDGTFRMTDVPAELLGNITVEAPGYLPAACNEITMAASSITLNPIALLSGDINNDNLVDIVDATAVGTDFGQTGISSPTDITRDNIIDIFDIVLVSVNFGEIGPTEWNCVMN